MHSGRLARLALVMAWLVLALPTLWDFLFGVWSGYSQGHELLLLSVAGWLVWRQRGAGDAAPKAWPIGLWLAWFAGLAAYAFGRSQEFIRVELLSVWWLAMVVAWVVWGWSGLRRTWFAWLFCLFAMPLPFGLVLLLTAPLKEAVSAVAAGVLSAVGYPVGRSGVVLTVGQYQLLVAEACAGLHSMFILEAMGLLYSHLAGHTSRWRTLWLAILAVPVSFVANVLRVMILVLVTYHLGDDAGQGFIHGFAGIVLFALALVLMALVDWVLGWIWPDGPRAAPAEPGLAQTPSEPSVQAGLRAWRVAPLVVSAVLVGALAQAGRPEASPEANARALVPLEELFPVQVGTWRQDPVSVGFVRPAFEQAKRFQMYDQVLERVYINPVGERIMLSVAYGRQQSVGLQIHRPEVCYKAGGFSVSAMQTGQIELPGHVLPVTRLVASMPDRQEPITYWRLLGDDVVSSEASLRLSQIASGLKGRGIDDGLLVRVSSLSSDAEAGWRLQQGFVQELDAAQDARQRQRTTGLRTATPAR
jgi:exosortase B